MIFEADLGREPRRDGVKGQRYQLEGHTNAEPKVHNDSVVHALEVNVT